MERECIWECKRDELREKKEEGVPGKASGEEPIGEKEVKSIRNKKKKEIISERRQGFVVLFGSCVAAVTGRCFVKTSLGLYSRPMLALHRPRSCWDSQ